MSNTTKTEVPAVEAAPSPELAQGVAPPSLTIQDLGNLRNILDVAAKRGVFKTEEFTIVGETYTKLANFIAAITPPEEAAVANAPAKEPAAE